MIEQIVFIGTFGAFFSFPPTRPQKSPQNGLPPSGTRPGTRWEGEIGLLFALGAFQGRIWSQNGTPNGTQNHLNIDLGAKSAQEPPGSPKRPQEAPKRPPEARIRDPPRPASTRKSCSKKLVKRIFETALRKIHQRPLAQWPVLGAQPHWRSGH